MFTPASDQIVSKVLDGEAIVIDLTTGIYYSMEQTAAKVWFELCNGTSLDALVQSARQTYPADADAPAQIEAFVAELVAEGLLSKAGPDAKPVDDMEAVSWPTTYSPPERMSFDDVAEMVALDPPLPELQRFSSDG